MADRKKVKGFEPTTQGSQIEVRADLIIKVLVSEQLLSVWFVLSFKLRDITIGRPTLIIINTNGPDITARITL